MSPINLKLLESEISVATLPSAFNLHFHPVIIGSPFWQCNFPFPLCIFAFLKKIVFPRKCWHIKLKDQCYEIHFLNIFHAPLETLNKNTSIFKPVTGLRNFWPYHDICRLACQEWGIKRREGENIERIRPYHHQGPSLSGPDSYRG